MRILIAGCGDLGLRTAQRLAHAGREVFGLRRDPSGLPDWLHPIRANLLERGDLTGLPETLDGIVYCPTPDRRDEAAYRQTFVAGLAKLLEALPGSRASIRLVLVSSTAVYGQDDGSEVSEASPCEPERFNGRILLEAEALALSSALDARVLRLGGIYGPGREWMIRRVRDGEGSCQAEPPRWTNRIHVDDAAAAIVHVLDSPERGTIWNGVDPSPATECEVMDWLARQLGVDRPQRATGGDAGKRVLPTRLRRSGFDWRYPDFRAGYRQVLEAGARQ